MPKRYWLMKSEPSSYSLDDLKRDGTTFWDGVRNFQARNLLRDEIKKGDEIFFYHSSVEPMAIVGVARVVKEGTPDQTQFDPQDHHYDADAKREDPRWFGVDIAFVRAFKKPVTLKELKQMPELEGMFLLRKGARLSVQPVSSEEWEIINAYAK